MLFLQFSNITIYIRVHGKMPQQHFKLLLFSNPGYNFLVLVESRGQICPVVSHLFKTLSLGLEKNNTLKCWSSIFPETLIYMVMVILKFHEVWISEWNLPRLVPKFQRYCNLGTQVQYRIQKKPLKVLRFLSGLV